MWWCLSPSRRRTDVLVPDEGRVLEQPGAKKIAHLTDVERPHVRRFVVQVVPLRLFRCERRHDQAGACAVRGELRYTTVFWRGRDDAEYQYLNVPGTVRVLLSAVTKRHTTLPWFPSVRGGARNLKGGVLRGGVEAWRRSTACREHLVFLECIVLIYSHRWFTCPSPAVPCATACFPSGSAQGGSQFSLFACGHRSCALPLARGE